MTWCCIFHSTCFCSISALCSAVQISFRKSPLLSLLLPNLCALPLDRNTFPILDHQYVIFLLEKMSAGAGSRVDSILLLFFFFTYGVFICCIAEWCCCKQTSRYFYIMFSHYHHHLRCGYRMFLWALLLCSTRVLTCLPLLLRWSLLDPPQKISFILSFLSSILSHPKRQQAHTQRKLKSFFFFFYDSTRFFFHWSIEQ